jgi:hypothetical protein
MGGEPERNKAKGISGRRRGSDMGGVASGGWVGGGNMTTTSGVAGAGAIDGELRARRWHTFPRRITYASHMLLCLPCSLSLSLSL